MHTFDRGKDSPPNLLRDQTGPNTLGRGDQEAGDGGSDQQAESEGGEFGPNTDFVRAFLVRLGDLGEQKLEELTAFWRTQPLGALRSAHAAVQSLVDDDEEVRAQVLAAQDQITAWTNGIGLVPVTAITGVSSRRLQARIDATPAAADAVTALTVADLLERRDAETLYAPWDAVVGHPKLPHYEDAETRS